MRTTTATGLDDDDVFGASLGDHGANGPAGGGAGGDGGEGDDGYCLVGDNEEHLARDTNSSTNIDDDDDGEFQEFWGIVQEGMDWLSPLHHDVAYVPTSTQEEKIDVDTQGESFRTYHNNNPALTHTVSHIHTHTHAHTRTHARTHTQLLLLDRVLLCTFDGAHAVDVFKLENHSD